MSAIAYFNAGIGNFIMYTPVLQALKEKYGALDLCLEEKGDYRLEQIKLIANNLPFVDNVVYNPTQRKYDYYFYSFHSTRIGFYDFFKNKNPELHFIKSNFRYEHEIEYYFRCLGIENKYKQYMPVADSPLIKDNRIKIGLNNCSFGYQQKFKKWFYFKKLAKTIKEYYNCCIIKIGAKNELNDVDIYDYDFVDKLNILETAKVMQQLDVLITVDTGLMHVADALNIKQIVIWGGSYLEKNRPLSNNAVIVKRSIPCFPCQGSKQYQICNKACLLSLKCSNIMAILKKIIKEREIKNDYNYSKSEAILTACK